MKIKNPQKRKTAMRKRRHRRVRAKISGTAERPRLSVRRSLKHIYAQLIDDEAGKTLTAAGDRDVKVKDKGKTAQAFETGKMLGQRAGERGIKEAVFDRGGYAYHGRVKAVADGARSAGLNL